MFFDFLRRHTAETKTLELIGLIKGVHKPEAADTTDGGSIVQKMVKQIDNSLRDEGRLMAPDARAFLTEARQTLKPLADPYASMMFQYAQEAPAIRSLPDVVPDPLWGLKFDDACRALQPSADAIFKTHYAADIRAQNADLTSDQRDARAKKDLGLRLAIKAGL